MLHDRVSFENKNLSLFLSRVLHKFMIPFHFLHFPSLFYYFLFINTHSADFGIPELITDCGFCGLHVLEQSNGVVGEAFGLALNDINALGPVLLEPGLV